MWLSLHAVLLLSCCAVQTPGYQAVTTPHAPRLRQPDGARDLLVLMDDGWDLALWTLLLHCWAYCNLVGCLAW